MDSMCLPFSYNFMKKLYGAHPGLPVRIIETHATITFPDNAKSHFSFGRQLLPGVSRYTIVRWSEISLINRQVNHGSRHRDRRLFFIRILWFQDSLTRFQFNLFPLR